MIVTISREYGAAGLAVADGVAEALGYELLTDDLPRAVAARLGTSAEEVTARTTAVPSFSERFLGSLDAGSPETIAAGDASRSNDFDEAMRREIERAVRERAERGNVVVLGHDAGSVLAGRPDLLRVFLTAQRPWRVARLVETFGQTIADVSADIDRTDAARRKFAKDRYKTSWGDARFYDLIVDTSRFGIDATVALVAAAVRAAERAR